MKYTAAIFAVTASLVWASVAQAQEPDVVYFGDDKIEVSEEQAERIREVQKRFDEESELQRKQLQELTKSLASQRAAVDTAKLNLLSAGQRAALAIRRQKRQEEEWRTRQANEIEHIKNLLPILEKLRATKSFSILEGPQRKGMDLPKAPVDEQSIVYVGKHFFFSDPLALPPDEEIAAVATAGSYKSFGAYLGGKLCGGFHPDANLRFITEHGTVQVLVCFGCAEAMLIDGESRLMVEIEREAYNALRDICMRNFRHRAHIGIPK